MIISVNLYLARNSSHQLSRPKNTCWIKRTTPGVGFIVINASRSVTAIAPMNMKDEPSSVPIGKKEPLKIRKTVKIN
jgi:hypothetical protein